MNKMNLRRAVKGALLSVSLVFGLMLVTSLTAQAQHRNRDDNGYGYGNGRNVYRIASQQGYRDGVDHGAEHLREGKRFNPEGTRHYKDGDEGYRSEYGNKDAYKQAYREGFRRGYEVGYRQYSDNRYPGRNRNDPNYGHDDDGYGSYGDYGNNGDYGDNGGNGGYGNNDIYRVARDQGYRDGVDHGAEHAREGKRYDPESTRHYKDGDEGYRRENGNKDAYKQAYRESFKRGYDVGFRQYSRGNNNGRTNNRRNTGGILGSIFGGW
jgi:hypothetical protein